MTPEQKIKHAILDQAIKKGTISAPELPITSTNIDELFDESNEDYKLQDLIYEFRNGEVETGLPCERSRHYESKSVAAKMPDGSWVGWTYWFGGGKYGEPEAFDWMSEAYDLNCTEEKKMVTVRTFSKIEINQPE